MTLDQISNLDIYDGLKKRKLKTFFHIKKLSELKAAHYSEKVSKNRMEKSEKSVRFQFIFEGDLSKVDYIGKCFDGCSYFQQRALRGIQHQCDQSRSSYYEY